MNTRKRPQQELAHYFDELLTELNDPSAVPETSISTNTRQLLNEENVTSHTVKKTALSDKPNDNIHSQYKAASVDASDIKDSHREQYSDRRSAPLPTSSVKPQRNTTIHTTTRVAEKEQSLDQIQQEKLQRLLRNLIPTNGDLAASAKQQLTDNFLGKGALETGTKTQQGTDTVVTTVTNTASSTNTLSVDEATSYVEESVSTEYQPWQPLTAQWAENGRPEWAQKPFDVLIITVNTIKLALPLEALDSIYPIDPEITPLFAQAKWFMGLQKSLTGNIKVIDSAQFLMPERIDQQTQAAFSYTVAINGSGWGLAVNSLEQPITIDPDTIRWRVRRSERPWFAGTIKEQLCVLLDIPTLAKYLVEKDKSIL